MEKTLMKEIDSQEEKFAILIVDDEQEILEFIAEDFNENYRVFTAGNGIEALEILNQEIIQLVISDVMMPEMDGYQLCEKMKSSMEYSHIPFILLTAKNSLQSKIEGLEMGADAYIEKPFSMDFLQAQATSLIKNRNKIKAYFASSPVIHLKSIAYSKAEELFLDKLQHLINEQLDNPSLDVEHLAEHMNMSRPTLYRKIKSISNLSPNELINIARLKKAAELLNEGALKIYEISEQVGYSSQTHFGRNFLKQFGMSPTEYVQANKAKGK